MRKIISFILTLTIALSLTVSFGVYSASDDGKIIFSENFDGDLSRWILTVNNCKNYEIEISYLTEKKEKIPYYKTVLWFPVGYATPASGDSGMLKFSGPVFNIEEDEKYTFAANINEDVKLSMVFIDEKGMAFEKNTPVATNATDYRCVSGMVTAPKGAKKAQIWIETKVTDNTKHSCIDDIVVVKGMVGFPKDVEKREETAHLQATDNSKTVMAEKNIVFYENFESKNTTDKTWETINKYSDGKLSIRKYTGLSGLKAMTVEDNQGASSVGKAIKVDGAIKGATYKVSFDAMNLQGSPIEVTVDLLDKDGKTTESISIKTEKSLGVKQQKKYECEIKVPFDAESMKVTVKSPSGTGTNIIDNILITSDIKESLTEETKLETIEKNGIVLLIGSSNAIVNGENKKIDKDNEKVVADTVNSRTLVPVRFIAENYGAKVGWHEETKTVTLDMSDKLVTIVLDKNEIDINGKIITTDVPATTIEGRTMLPLRAFAESVMGKKIFWDDRGLIVITDEEILDLKTDEDTILKLIEKVK